MCCDSYSSPSTSTFPSALRASPPQAICYTAYTIRLFAINTYGLVIHEFDPWFNFRATQYLSDNGVKAFFQWFDYMSWYPLGRPVGTTIYPGMQLTSVAIHRALAFLGRPMPVPPPKKKICSSTFGTDLCSERS